MHAPAQVVGLRNGWQTAVVMAGLTTKIHAKRLAQGSEVVLELRSPGAPARCARDGARSGPWQRVRRSGRWQCKALSRLHPMAVKPSKGLHGRDACCC